MKNKKGGGGTVIFFVFLIVAAGFYFFIYDGGIHNIFKFNPFQNVTNPNVTCSSEFQHITTGTAFSNGNCCSGLVPKAPEGFVGGAWCIQPSYQVNCINSTDGMGIYAMGGLTSNNSKFLMEANCPE